MGWQKLPGWLPRPDPVPVSSHLWTRTGDGGSTACSWPRVLWDVQGLHHRVTRRVAPKRADVTRRPVAPTDGVSVFGQTCAYRRRTCAHTDTRWTHKLQHITQANPAHRVNWQQHVYPNNGNPVPLATYSQSGTQDRATRLKQWGIHVCSTALLIHVCGTRWQQQQPKKGNLRVHPGSRGFYNWTDSTAPNPTARFGPHNLHFIILPRI